MSAGRTLTFRILGSVDVVCDGRSLPLGGGKQRALLALLLLEANRVVVSDQLIERLWGERPPANPVTALQMLVSLLRKVLEPDRARGTPARLLVTHPAGYELRVDPEQLDVQRFERLLESGGHALGRGEAGLAAEQLREALALWRGPALADLTYEAFAASEIARLEELRLVALEERIEADLALGAHAGLVGELEALVAEHPLRERLRAQLMLALYRSGRQAEALAAYQAARRALVDELGIDPSSTLQRLERAILAQDAALDLSAAQAQWPSLSAAASTQDVVSGQVPYLEITTPDGDAYGTTELRGGRLVIGRAIGGGDDAADLALPDPARLLSRVHCTLERVAGHWSIVEVRGANGTFLRHRGAGEVERIADVHVLETGDVIALPASGENGDIRFWELAFCDPNETVLAYAPPRILEYDFAARELAIVDGRVRRVVSLTPPELSLVGYMAERATRSGESAPLCRHPELIEAVYGDPVAVRRSDLARLISDVRGKIELEPSRPELLVSVPSLGYRLHLSVSDNPPAA